MQAHYDWPCPYCGAICESRRKLHKHKLEMHGDVYSTKHHWYPPLPGGNCVFCNRWFKYRHTLRYHEKVCPVNPDAIPVKGHPFSESAKEKMRETNNQKHLMGGHRKGSGRGKKGTYKGYYCDSSWELAYVVYNIDHDIQFERNETTFTYVFDGKEHKYLPDFSIGDVYIERLCPPKVLLV